MKLKSAILALFLILATALTFAATNKSTVIFSQSVTVGSATLDPGEYKVEWIGTGSQVDVTFWRGKNKILTVPAQYNEAHNPYDAVTVRPEPSGGNTLLKIDAKNASLRFGDSDAIGQ